MITIIVAIDKKRGIGNKGKLLAYIPGDLPRFRKLTTGNTVIMGRKTFDSLPNGPLPNRQNIVITRNKDLKIKGAEIAYSLQEAINKSTGKIFIIGGGQIYEDSLEIADRLLITKINKQFTADTYFPEFDDTWKLISSQENECDDFTYTYDTYEKI
ncbi:MAG: dihydrofolate reductase [Spirochaetales bacterium]|nr:dihydrofolate reductase [Spirochaetales bacterium]